MAGWNYEECKSNNAVADIEEGQFYFSMLTRNFLDHLGLEDMGIDLAKYICKEYLSLASRHHLGRMRFFYDFYDSSDLVNFWDGESFFKDGETTGFLRDFFDKKLLTSEELKVKVDLAGFRKFVKTLRTRSKQKKESPQKKVAEKLDLGKFVVGRYPVWEKLSRRKGGGFAISHYVRFRGWMRGDWIFFDDRKKGADSNGVTWSEAKPTAEEKAEEKARLKKIRERKAAQKARAAERAKAKKAAEKAKKAEKAAAKKSQKTLTAAAHCAIVG